MLSWLLGEDRADDVTALLGAAESVLASDLTLIECDRVLIRAVALREMREAEAATRRRALNEAALGWHTFRLAPEIVERARRAFQPEPIRTLDAIHLGTLLFARQVVAGVALLSLDRRIRVAASELGVDVQP